MLCDGVTLTVVQSALFRGGVVICLSWLQGISGEILLQFFFPSVIRFLKSSYGLQVAEEFQMS